MRNWGWVSTVLFFLMVARGASPSAGAELKPDTATDIPKEVRALEGVYIGSWTMYGIDDKNQVTKRMAWTDTVKASHAEVGGDRAWVTIVDEMNFEGGKAPPFKIEGKEGYFLTKDGGLG